MIATLPKLHQNVQETYFVGFLAVGVDQIEILHEDLGVQFPLHLAQTNVDFNLLLRRQALLNVSFNSTQEERAKNLIENQLDE